MNRISGKELLALCGLTLAAVVLRTHNLGQWPIFGDEVNTIVESRDFIHFIDSTAINRWTFVTNFLNHFLTGLTYALFGESLITARLVPVLFGILTIPVFYFLVRRIFGAPVSFLTALYMTFSPNLIFLSGFARYNSMLFFFGGVSYLVLLEGILQRRRFFIALGAVFTLLAVLSHSTGIMVPAVAVAVLLLFTFSEKEQWKFCIQALAILLLPYLVISTLFLDDLYWKGSVILKKFMGAGLGYSPWRLMASIAYNDGLIHFMLTLVAAYMVVRTRKREGLAAALYWFMPLVLIVLMSFGFHTGPRYLQSALPGFYLLAAMGTVGLIRHAGRWAAFLKIALPVLVVVSQVPLLASNWLDGGRYDTVSATRFLEECRKERPDEPIFAESHMIYEVHSEHRLDVPELPFTLEELKKALEGVESALIVFPLQRGVPQGFKGWDYMRWLEANCELLEVFSSRRFDIMRFEVAVYRYPAGGEGTR